MWRCIVRCCECKRVGSGSTSSKEVVAAGRQSCEVPQKSWRVCGGQAGYFQQALPCKRPRMNECRVLYLVAVGSMMQYVDLNTLDCASLIGFPSRPLGGGPTPSSQAPAPCLSPPPPASASPRRPRCRPQHPGLMLRPCAGCGNIRDSGISFSIETKNQTVENGIRFNSCNFLYFLNAFPLLLLHFSRYTHYYSRD